MSTLRLYTLANCDTCRKAVKWLRARGVAFEERAIRETPPTPAELRTVLAAYDGELKKLFNTAGGDYREQKLGEKLPSLTESAALALLAGNGSLVKRPFAVGGGVALVGFDEKAWGTAFPREMTAVAHSSHSASSSTISLRLRELAQLFNSMDPSPFHERALDADAEEFIVGSAREHMKDRSEFHLHIHLLAPPSPERADGVEESLRHYFHMRSEAKKREFRQLMRRGRVSLFIGLLFLVACFFIEEMVAKFGYGTAAELIRESLTIGGWVAMWRPLEIYLYDWWPLRDERRLLERLARVRVKLILPTTQKPS